MSDISKIKVSSVEYDIKDIQARKDLGNLGTRVTELEQHGGGGSVPKPLTYDYMPEGYPSKAMGTLTLLEAQELAFVLNNGIYGAPIASAFKVVEGQTYTVNWDGTEYECIGSVFNDSMLFFGNGSIMGGGNDTGEPFCYAYLKTAAKGMFGTLDTSASHIISVKKTGEIVTPMAEEFLPAVVGTTAFISYDSDSGAYGSELTYDELYERLLGGKQVVLHKTVEKEYRYLTKWKKDSSGRIDLAFAGEVDYSVSLYTGGTIGGAP